MKLGAGPQEPSAMWEKLADFMKSIELKLLKMKLENQILSDPGLEQNVKALLLSFPNEDPDNLYSDSIKWR